MIFSSAVNNRWVIFDAFEPYCSPWKAWEKCCNSVLLHSLCVIPTVGWRGGKKWGGEAGECGQQRFCSVQTTPGITNLAALNQSQEQTTHEHGKLPLPPFFYWSYTEWTSGFKNLSLQLPKSKPDHDENPFEQLNTHFAYSSVSAEDKFQLCYVGARCLR